MLNIYMSNSELQKIISKCLERDRKAQFELYQLCFEPLMKTCIRYKRNREDAVSLLNDGFLKILLNLKSYEHKRDFFPWASTIMVRTAIDDYRKHKTYNDETDFKHNEEELEDLRLQHAHVLVIDQLSTAEVMEIIFALPEKERLVFNLYEWEGYQHAEIAEKLGFSERSSKRYLKSAKLMLIQLIEKRSDLKKVV